MIFNIIYFSCLIIPLICALQIGAASTVAEKIISLFNILFCLCAIFGLINKSVMRFVIKKLTVILKIPPFVMALYVGYVMLCTFLGGFYLLTVAFPLSVVSFLMMMKFSVRYSKFVNN